MSDNVKHVGIKLAPEVIELLKTHPLYCPVRNGYRNTGIGPLIRKIVHAEVGLKEKEDGTLAHQKNARQNFNKRKRAAVSSCAE